MRKLSNKMLYRFLVMFLTILLFFNNYYTYAYAYSIYKVNSKSEVRLEDDFYNYINDDWLSKAKLPKGYTTYSSFEEANIKVKQDLKNIINDIRSNKNKYQDSSEEIKILNLYDNYLDENNKKTEGIKILRNYIENIHNIQTLDDFRNYLTDLNAFSTQSIINIGVGADLKNSTVNILYIGESDLGLNNSEYYIERNDLNKKIETEYKKYISKLYKLIGESRNNANKKADRFYEMEKKLAKNIPTIKQNAEDLDIIKKSYNIYSVKELDELASNIKFNEIFKKLNIDDPNKIVVNNPQYIKQLNKLMIENNIEDIKLFLETNILMKSSDYLSKDFRDASDGLSKTIYGIKDKISDEEKAINLVNSVLSEPLGKIYVKKHFSEDSKKEVETLTSEIIDNFKYRINNLEWMSEITKEKAVKKLNNINVKIGYPDVWRDYAQLTIKSHNNCGCLLENVLNVYSFQLKEELSLLNKEVERNSWEMSPQTVNAYYNPTKNEIVFPAAILQKPFYDIKNNKVENLGGIGAVIGHELTHAFDNTGSKFDECGNLNNWWTDKDYKEFNIRSKRVMDYYSHIQINSGEFVDGKLTSGENISDLGGVACIIDIANNINNVNLKELFKNYAIIWRGINTKEMESYLLKNDVHSPKKARVNIVLSQFEEFYNVYGIKQGDDMYVSPENRIKVW
ncbi:MULTISPECIES: M13 family metallopeptidase [Clostridium]|uniref:M13 family metallopeptidase n=1 Tax=Clostridium aquiflavi TaxID=3073603 RepID=A0ABU1EKQ6_9CLOT|nr:MULTISPECIES: M13 family metallopeptidase [unclassified Clostridium]MDR5588971.1 M13 family metallopeptidase [Clostridium sp. 5N-1]NFG62401.1 M13 family metallopeptidase [Clostridium botulinum]NFQ10238.1 M13 family metallopeptidase [Clostridium botulinum]